MFEADINRPPKNLFFDSGSFALWTEAEKYAEEHNVGEWEYYNTDEFFAYLDSYAKFIKKAKVSIDICANVDVLPFRGSRKPPKGMTSHELSWRNLKLLEERGIKPVPVVHYGADIDVYLRRYIEAGYPLIGLGGLVGSISDESCRRWIDSCFDMVCQRDGFPMVDLHGFGVTAVEMIARYPWYSVDSTTWTKAGGFGNIVVPRRRKGEWVFTKSCLERVGLSTKNWVSDTQPFIVIMSDQSTRADGNKLNFVTCSKGEQKVIRDWVEHNGLTIGKDPGDDGVFTNHERRRDANVCFFEGLRKAIPLRTDFKWNKKKQATLWDIPVPKVRPPEKQLKRPRPESDRLIIFYSGVTSHEYGPERVMDTDANIMLSYFNSHGKKQPCPQFRRVHKARKQK